MAIIEDFGQKIGGARKDVWKLTGITAKDFAEMNEMERDAYVKKDNVWLRPDWEQVVADGTPQAVAYWQNKMRQSIPPSPPEASEEAQLRYVDVVSQIRDAVMAVRDEAGIRRFFQDFLLRNFTNSNGSRYYVTVLDVAQGIVTNKVLSAAQVSFSKMEREAKKKMFGIPKDEQAYVAAKQNLEIYCYDGDKVQMGEDPYTPGSTRMTIRDGWGSTYFYFREGSEYNDTGKWEKGTWFVMGGNRKPLRNNIPTREEAEAFVEEFAKASQMVADLDKASKDKDEDASGRKKNYVPRQLAYIRYTGPDFRSGREANSQMFLKDLKFRGGEFGNWLSGHDRQASLNMAYDALRNLAVILKVRPEDISLDGQLAIAFGARGRGGASAGAAHYEPLRQVINLTKMSGAGCLAHEWGHALDHAIGIAGGQSGFASEAKSIKGLPDAFPILMDRLKWKEVVVPADERRQELDPEIKRAKKNLEGWIRSVKPAKMPEDLEKAWNEIAQRIVQHPENFSGAEYWSAFRGGDVITNPAVEELSQISKITTGHVIKRSDKHQIALWAAEVKRFNKAVQEMESCKKRVKTDFYKGSIEFDTIFSKYGHGYWQSDCEMFARAFDCYIADKVKEQGYRSDYLSSNADGFSIDMGGRTIAAYPCGEERAVINEAFDMLFDELKERQVLREAEIEEPGREEPFVEENRAERAQWAPEEGRKVRYEQLSLDELMFAATPKVSQGRNSNRGKEAEPER